MAEIQNWHRELALGLFLRVMEPTTEYNTEEIKALMSQCIADTIADHESERVKELMNENNALRHRNWELEEILATNEGKRMMIEYNSTREAQDDTEL